MKKLEILGKYKNGNAFVAIYNDGTKIKYTPDDEMISSFAENIDIKITNKCLNDCKFCHEGSNSSGKHCNIDLSFWNTLRPYQEVALGGGNVLMHPRFEELLERLKERKVIANITVRQNDFINEYDRIKRLYDEKLLYGIGVSFVKCDDRFFDMMKTIPSTVLHVINGILTPSDIDYIIKYTKNLKLLILGYKEVRRGVEYKTKNDELISQNKKYLEGKIEDLFKSCKLVSFDNLAIEQLNIKEKVSEKEWERCYMGEEGSNTFYIDAVEEKYAQSSTADLNEESRYPLENKTVEEMFKDIAKKSKQPYLEKPEEKLLERFKGQCNKLEYKLLERTFRNI